MDPTKIVPNTAQRVQMEAVYKMASEKIGVNAAHVVNLESAICCLGSLIEQRRWPFKSIDREQFSSMALRMGQYLYLARYSETILIDMLNVAAEPIVYLHTEISIMKNGNSNLKDVADAVLLLIDSLNEINNEYAVFQDILNEKESRFSSRARLALIK